ncbi:MAG: hypothetical protein WD066_14765, partial [Planctomycetaceae bacterium]
PRPLRHEEKMWVMTRVEAKRSPQRIAPAGSSLGAIRRIHSLTGGTLSRRIDPSHPSIDEIIA